MTSADPSGGLTRQNTVYRHMIAVTDRVAEAALSGADPAELTRVFAAMARKTVFLLDPTLSLRASGGGVDGGADWDPGDVVMARLLSALTAERRPLRVPAVPGAGALERGCVATPIAIGGTMLGYLLVLDEESGPDANDVDLLIASHAATLFALTLAHERTATDLGLRYQGAVVDALVSGHFLDASDARRKALSIGLPGNIPFRVGVLRVNPARSGLTHGGAIPLGGHVVEHAVLDELVGQFAVSIPGVVVVARGWEVLTIIPEPDGRPDREMGPVDVMSALAGLIREADIVPLPTAGLSERTARPDLTPGALRQAEHAIDLGLRLGRPGQVIGYDELGIYRLLLQIGDMQQLWQFADDVLGPLLEYDATHKLDLIRTLSVYLNQHASLKQAARVLRVHANTISYRVHKIEQLTPLDLTNADDRLVAHVAVKIVESLRAGDAAPELPVSRAPAAGRPVS